MPAVSKQWTLTSDFADWLLTNVNATAVADQLQLDLASAPAAFNYLVASLGGTIIRVNADTGLILGEYRGAPLGLSTTPQALCVDSLGNVWAGNASENVNGSVVKIGMLLGGTRVGEFVSPPFTYNTCIDRDGDLKIRTSAGLGNVLAWPNVTDGAGGTTALVEDAVDEAILIYQRTGTNCRNVLCVGVAANGNPWIAGWPSISANQAVVELLASNGSVQNSGDPLRTAGGRSGCIDPATGVLWSPDGGGNHDGRSVLKLDTGTHVATDILVTASPAEAPTGLCIGLGASSNFVYVTTEGSTSRLWRLDKVTNAISAGNFPVTIGNLQPRSLCCTAADGHIWVACKTGNQILRYDTAGALQATIACSSPQGICVVAGKVWVSCADGNLRRFNPASAATPDLVVAVGGTPTTIGPFMGGTVTPATLQPSGTGAVIYDAVEQVDWATIDWAETVPANTSLRVDWRVASALNSFGPFTTATNPPGSPMNQSGRYVEVLVAFDRLTPTETGTPVLPDIRISGTSVGPAGGGPTLIDAAQGSAGGFITVPGAPNILLLVPSQFPAGLFEALPDEWLGQLAQRSTHFTKAYADEREAATLASMLTGRYAFHTGIGAEVLLGNHPLLNPAQCLPAALRAAFPSLLYRFGFFGWWPLEFEGKASLPAQAGFDVFEGVLQMPGTPTGWRRRNFATAVLDETRRFIQDSTSRGVPWFAVVSTGNYESPFDARLADFAEAVRQDVWANTEVFLWALSPARVPLLVSGPRNVLPGRTSASLVAPSDLYATLFDLCGGGSVPLESSSFYPVLTSAVGTGSRTFVLLERFSPNGYNLAAATPGKRAILSSTYKLVRNVAGVAFPDATDEFYDLVNDPAESTNLIPGGATGSLTAGELSAYNGLKSTYITETSTP